MNSNDPSLSVVDWESALENTGGDKELLKILIDTAVEEMPGLMSQLETALTAKEGPVARRMAHTVRGESRTLGGRVTEKIAGEIEQLVESEDLASATSLLPELQKQVELMIAEMNAFE